MNTNRGLFGSSLHLSQGGGGGGWGATAREEDLVAPASGERSGAAATHREREERGEERAFVVPRELREDAVQNGGKLRTGGREATTRCFFTTFSF